MVTAEQAFCAAKTRSMSTKESQSQNDALREASERSYADLAFRIAKTDKLRENQRNQVIRLLQAFFDIPNVPSNTSRIKETATPATAKPESKIKTQSTNSTFMEANDHDHVLEQTEPVPAPTVVRTISADQPTRSRPTLGRSQSFGSEPEPEDGPSETPQQQQQQQQQTQQHPKMSANWNNVPLRRRKKKLSPRTIARRLTRKYKNQKSPSQWYHSVAAKNRLGSINEDIFMSDSDIDTSSESESSSLRQAVLGALSQQQNPAAGAVSAVSDEPLLSPLQQAKRDMLQALNETLGDANTPAFQLALQKLIQHYDPSKLDPRIRPTASRTRDGFQQLEGIGISAGKPSFPGCIGRNTSGDPLFKLGTMSFDMFCPTQLVVSVQGTFVLIDIVDGKSPEAVKNVPKDLLADVRFGKSPVRTYNIVTPFTIEPWKPEFGEDSPNKGITQDQPPIRGIMTTYGFILPYPLQNHRFSVWFTKGTLEVVDGDNDKNEKWFQIFDKSNNNDSTNPAHQTTTSHKRTMVESGKVLAAKLLMGASTNDQLDEDGKLSYELTRPMASHIDLIYLDKKLQVLRGSSGTVYVHVRIPGRKAVRNSTNSNAKIASILNDNVFLMSDESHHDGENDMDGSSSSSITRMTIDEDTQRQARELIEGGRLKEAAELLGRAHNGGLKTWQNARSHSQASDDSQPCVTRDAKVRRTASENNLYAPVAPVRKRGYAREA